MKYRLTICTGLCALFCSASLAEPVAQPMAELGHAILKQLIEINTTASHGSIPAVQAIYERLRGKNLAKPVLYIGHLDVVEALRAHAFTEFAALTVFLNRT